MKKILLVVLAVAGMLFLQGCTTKSSTKVPRNGIMTKDEVTFPKPEKSIYKKALGVNLENIRKIEVGMSKDEIRKLIGVPHFSAGLAYVVEWDYLFNLKEKAGDKDMICQYKVVYDFDTYKAASLFWNTKECEDFVNKIKKTQSIELSSDFLFKFASANLNKNGKNEISNLVNKFGKENIKTIFVVGHTDLIGSDESNLILSQKRANSVKNEFIKNGILGSKITTSGAGESEPVKECDSNLAKNKLIECLAPNRRVNVDITTY